MRKETQWTRLLDLKDTQHVLERNAECKQNFLFVYMRESTGQSDRGHSEDKNKPILHIRKPSAPPGKNKRSPSSETPSK